MKSSSFVIVRMLAIMALVFSQTVHAQSNGRPNNNGSTSGNPFDCSRNPNLCTGNNGNGVGNTGPGNQGNDKPVGNANGPGQGGGNNPGNGGGNNPGNGGGNNPGHGGGPIDPVGPTDPTGPTAPTNPTTPTTPTNPSNPTNPTTPTTPTSPADPTTPSNPSNPSNPANPSNPSNPTEPTTPTDTPPSGSDGSPAEPSQPTDSSPTPQPTEQPTERAKRSLRAKVQPLFYLDFDSATGIVAIESGKGLRPQTGSQLQLTQKADQYQKTSTELMEGGIGAAVTLYFKNATGVAANFWAQVGLIPMKGTQISSVRYAKTLAEAQSLPGYRQAPLNVTDLYSWKNGESVSYKSKGGTIFIASTGVGMAGLTATYLAQGTFETYVEKVDASHVYVKITESKLGALSKGAGAALVAVALQEFKNADDGFSYLLNLQNEDARKVYHDLVRGNVAAAQQMAGQVQALFQAPVQKVESFKRTSKGNGFSLFLGVPILMNATSSENKIQSFNTTDLFIENSKVDANFGVYDLTAQTRAFGTHTVISKGFYGVQYKMMNLQTSAMKDASKFGRFSYVYQNDHTSARSLQQSLDHLFQATGLSLVQVGVPTAQSQLDFTNLTLNLTLSAANTDNLVKNLAGLDRKSLEDWATKRVRFAHLQKGEALCGQTYEAGRSCERELVTGTTYAAKKMQEALVKMKANQNSPVEYTKAYAEFGKAAMTNAVSLGMMLALAGRGVEVTFAIEGTYLKAYNVTYQSKADGSLELVTSHGSKDQSLEPQNKRSRLHGLITNKNLSGLGAPL